ncbi:MAG: ROK family protein, partial [Paracoccaceae bacterium]
MIAAGIDLGGTKIEAQVFDADWNCAEKQRSATPQTYADLLATVAAHVDWI